MLLCSDCRKEVKPVVALDIDGTLGDYHTHFLEFSERWLGQSFNVPYVYRGDQAFRDWFCETFEVDYTTFRQIKLAYRQGGLKRMMPTFAGARSLAQELQLSGVEVWVTTTRPHDRYDRVDPDTREWLRRNGIPFSGLLFDEDKMEALYEIIDPERVVAVLDDQTEVLSEASAKFGCGVAILRRTLYNNAAHWTREVADLTEALLVIKIQVEKWKAVHA